MGIRRGSISTPIIADGLVFNMDAANRASYVPNATTSYNTVDLTTSGSLYNDTNFITQPVSASCWNFDGVDDYIKVQTNQILLPGDATISWWMTLASSQITYAGILAAYNYWASGENNSFAVQWNSNKLRIVSSDAQSSTSVFLEAPNSPSFSVDTWFNVAVVLDTTTDTIQPYWNGTNQGWSALATSGRTFVGIDEGITIGAYITDKSPSTTYAMDGQISNVQIYNRALSANEVLHNYNALKGRFA